jgi:mannosyltransferase
MTTISAPNVNAVRPQEAARESSRTYAAIILLLILVAASALRFYRLGEGLWLDEIITDYEYVRLPYHEIVTTYDSENQHFLYTLMARAAYDLFGPSPWALRLPAALFGIGSLLALYLLARRVTSVSEALLATALLAFSYHHIWFSQNARGYSGLLFWTLLSSWGLLAALQTGRIRYWLAFAGAVALGMYTHMTMAFVVIGQAAAAALWLISHREQTAILLRGMVIGFGGAGSLSLLLYAPVLPQLFRGLGREPSVVGEWKSPLWTLSELLRGLNIGFAGGLAALIALIVVAAGLFSYLQRQPAIVVLLGVPVMAGALVVIGMGHHLWPRFFYFAFGFGALVLVRGAFLIGHWVTDRLARQLPGLRAVNSAWGGIAVCLILIIAAAASTPKVYGPKQDYEGAMAFVAAQRQPGDAVVTASVAALPYKNYYHTDWQVVEDVAMLNATRDSAARTWFVYTFPPVLEAVLPEVMTSLNQDFEVVARFEGTVSGGTVYVLRADKNSVVSATNAR